MSVQITRRGLFKLAAVGGVAAGAEGCSSMVPQPMHRPVPGPTRLVQTACGACSSGCGISVRVVGDNAVQIEGVAGHPVNGTGMCPRGIAEIQNLYHPERLTSPVKGDKASPSPSFTPLTWDDAIASVAGRLAGGKAVIGIGDVSRGVARLVEQIARKVGARLVSVELPHGQGPADALQQMLGSSAYEYDVGRADFVLSLGSDWLQSARSPVEVQRAFAAIRTERRVRGRVVTASGRLSITASKGDLWLPVRSDHLPLFALSIAHELVAGAPSLLSPEQRKGAEAHAGFASLVALVGDGRFVPDRVAARLGIEAAAIHELAAGLANASYPLVVTDRGAPAIQQVGVMLNLLLGAVGREGGLREVPALPVPDALVAADRPPRATRFPDDAGAVLVVGANPMYTMPASAGWRAGLAAASFVACLSPVADETCGVADVVLPPSTPLESRQLAWGVSRGGAGFATVGPAAVPTMYDTLEVEEILLRIAASAGVGLPWKGAAAYFPAVAESLGAAELVEEGGFAMVDPVAAAAGEDSSADATGDTNEDKAASDHADADAGGSGNPAADAVGGAATSAATRRWSFAADDLAKLTDPSDSTDYPLVLETYVPSAFARGEGAHLPYLHGLTGAFEREVWRTTAEINPETAKRMGVEDGHFISIESSNGSITAIARVRNGVRPDVVAIGIGLGRTALGEYAAGYGANPQKLVNDAAPTRVRVGRSS